MKERPILFSGPMVRAILEGRKTVTRRALKVQPVLKGKFWELGGAGWSVGCQSITPVTGHSLANRCPYGQPGDRLWVRETLHYDCEYGHYYAAGGQHGETVYLSSLFDDDAAQTGPSYDGQLPERSVPSIHLHRRYSRILLEVTAVRVERLQDISEEQANAEGVLPAEHCIGPLGTSLGAIRCQHCGQLRQQHIGMALACVGGTGTCWNGNTARGGFAVLWESINGPGSWEANPWVWVVEFRRVTP